MKKSFARTIASATLFLCCSVVTCFAASNDQGLQPEPSAPAPNQTLSNQPTHNGVSFDRDYFTGYVTDTTSILTSPVRWGSSDWITAAGIVGISVGLYTQDQKIQTWVHKNKTSTIDRLGDNATLVGFGALTVPLLGGLYLYGYAADDPKACSTVLLTTESFVLTGVFVQTLKFGTHRHRPYTGDPEHAWGGPGIINNGDHLSFPSGHASSAFAISTVIATEYENSLVVPPLAYGVASLVAVNRVLHNAHWSSDIFVGSAIGYFTGKAVVKSHHNNTRFSLLPLMDGEHTGLAVTYNY